MRRLQQVDQRTAGGEGGASLRSPGGELPGGSLVDWSKAAVPVGSSVGPSGALTGPGCGCGAGTPANRDESVVAPALANGVRAAKADRRARWPGLDRATAAAVIEAAEPAANRSAVNPAFLGRAGASAKGTTGLMDFQVTVRDDPPPGFETAKKQGCFLAEIAETWEADDDTAPSRTADLPIPEKDVITTANNLLIPFDEDVFEHNVNLDAKVAEGSGYLGEDCWVNEVCPWLALLYPDFAPYFGEDDLGMTWVYLMVDEPTKITTESVTHLFDYGDRRWQDIGMCKLIFAVSALHFFAACDAVLEVDGANTQEWRLRYWVGVVHHPSVFANFQTQGVVRGEPDFSEVAFEASQVYSAHSISDFPNAYGDDVREDVEWQAQVFMSVVERVDVTILYRGVSEATGQRLMYPDDWRINHREYPRGGSYFYSTDQFADKWINDGFYSGDNHDERHWGRVGYQETAGRARSHIGNMLRGEVAFKVEKASGLTEKKIKKEGFKCLFGDEVIVEAAITYVPLYGNLAGEPVTCLVRRVLDTADLKDARTLFGDGENLARGDAWQQKLYQVWDYGMLYDDLLQP